MSKELTSGTPSSFPHSGPMTIYHTYKSCASRRRGPETAHHIWHTIEIKLLITKIGLALHRTQIFGQFPTFSIRWDLFGVFSSNSRKWLCFAKYQPRITVNYPKEFTMRLGPAGRLLIPF